MTPEEVLSALKRHHVARGVQLLVAQYIEERRMLAKLAADEPAFLNPLEAMTAKMTRDRVLKEEAAKGNP